MTNERVFDLAWLQSSRDVADLEAAWAHLVARYSPLLLNVARGLGGDHDDVLDRYAFVLERLRGDDFRRLRAFRVDGPAQFSTWLVVTARRLCLDHHRSRFGRAPAAANGDRGLRAIRQRLELNDGERIDLTGIPDSERPSPDETLEGRERNIALSHLLRRLPPNDRLLLQLRFRDDLSAIEIARVMGFPTLFHVYRRLRTVLATLRQAIERDPLFEQES